MASLSNHPWWALGMGVAQGGREAGELNSLAQEPPEQRTEDRGQRAKSQGCSLASPCHQEPLAGII